MNTILMRKLSECIKFSVLNTKIATVDIGKHDFNESCYRIYHKIKNIIENSTENDNLTRSEYNIIVDETETYLRYHLMEFLIKYHKRLWKRFDVPRKFFFSVGNDWSEDVNKLREASIKYMKCFDQRLNKVDSFVLKNNC